MSRNNDVQKLLLAIRDTNINHAVTDIVPGWDALKHNMVLGHCKRQGLITAVYINPTCDTIEGYALPKLTFEGEAFIREHSLVSRCVLYLKQGSKTTYALIAAFSSPAALLLWRSTHHFEWMRVHIWHLL